MADLEQNKSGVSESGTRYIHTIPYPLKLSTLHKFYIQKIPILVDLKIIKKWF